VAIYPAQFSSYLKQRSQRQPARSPSKKINGTDVALPDGAVKFSLAGVQLKFTANVEGERLTVSSGGNTGRCIFKVASERFPSLPETEYAAMLVAKMIGVQTANCRRISRDLISGVPAELLAQGERVLVVDRFDRAEDDRRVQIEDTAQILGAIGDRRYTMATTETVINMCAASAPTTAMTYWKPFAGWLQTYS